MLPECLWISKVSLAAHLTVDSATDTVKRSNVEDEASLVLEVLVTELARKHLQADKTLTCFEVQKHY